MEHSCHICGGALGKVRAPLDPIYKLQVVVCPKCGAACVRRRHPISASWRAVRRGLATAIGLGWRMVGCFLVVGFSLGLPQMLSDTFNQAGPLEVWRMSRAGELDGRWMEGWKGENGPLIAGVGVAWCIGVGAALTAGFGHARRRWAVWAIFAGALVGLSVLAEFFESYVDRAMYRQQASDPMPEVSAQFSHLYRTGGWMAVGLGVAVAGVPLGRGLRRAFAKGDARRWGAMRRRVRRRRLAT